MEVLPKPLILDANGNIVEIGKGISSSPGLEKAKKLNQQVNKKSPMKKGPDGRTPT